jgi:glycosyltransferase involved in cell wall biosynthesis
MLHHKLSTDMRVDPQLGICAYLTNFGHQVTWCVSQGKDCPPRQFRLNSVKVYDIPYRHYLPGDSLLAKVINRIPNILRRMRLILSIFREGEYNLIFARYEPFDGLIAAYLKRKYRIPFVYALDNPLEQRLDAFRIEYGNPRSLQSLVLRFYTWLELRIMKKADLVLPITQWSEEGLVKRGISKSKLMPYPSGADTDHLYRNLPSFPKIDGANADVRVRYHLADSRVIIYVGTMARTRNLSVLIDAFARVRQKNSRVKLLMVGDGSDRDNLGSLADTLGIKDEVVFTGQVPQSEVPFLIAASDIGVSPVPPLSFYKVSSPIKLFEYMAMAKPVVANEEIFEHKEVLKESGGGILVPFDSGAFARAIVELLDSPQKAVELGWKGQEWVMKNRSYEVLARRLEKRCLELYNR